MDIKFFLSRATLYSLLSAARVTLMTRFLRLFQTMATEQFSLKWNNHTRHIVGVFESLLQSGESYTDKSLIIL